MNFAQHTAQARELVSCHACALVCRGAAAEGDSTALCPRCGASLHSRKMHSISRTWALLIAAAILYIPANVFPIMSVTTLGDVQADTIMSGVIFLTQSGQWPLALLIFFASIFVPVMKLLIIALLLISIQRQSTWRPLDRTKLYRITERVGRWSMVDIYVVTILVTLVQLGALATVEVEVGAVYFGAVVVLTMLAAGSFDPRLIWDKVQRDEL